MTNALLSAPSARSTGAQFARRDDQTHRSALARRDLISTVRLA